MPDFQNSDLVLIRHNTVEDPVSTNDGVPCVFIKSRRISRKTEGHGLQEIGSFFDLVNDFVGHSGVIRGDLIFDLAKLSQSGSRPDYLENHVAISRLTSS